VQVIDEKLKIPIGRLEHSQPVIRARSSFDATAGVHENEDEEQE